jgi:hypothetical protein
LPGGVSRTVIGFNGLAGLCRCLEVRTQLGTDRIGVGGMQSLEGIRGPPVK